MVRATILIVVGQLRGWDGINFRWENNEPTDEWRWLRTAKFGRRNLNNLGARSFFSKASSQSAIFWTAFHTKVELLKKRKEIKIVIYNVRISRNIRIFTTLLSFAASPCTSLSTCAMAKRSFSDLTNDEGRLRKKETILRERKALLIIF